MKEIKFSFQGRVIAAQLGSRVEKKALYGYSRRVAEKDGVVLSRGILTPDGNLYRKDQITMAKVDPEGTPVDEVASEIEGQIVDLKPSSFEIENEIRPAALTRLATFAVSDVYPVNALDVSAGLYETEFSFRKSVQHKEALLLVKEGGAFLLVGVEKQSAFVGLDVAYSFFDADDDTEESEELDFSMV